MFNWVLFVILIYITPLIVIWTKHILKLDSRQIFVFYPTTNVSNYEDRCLWAILCEFIIRASRKNRNTKIILMTSYYASHLSNLLKSASEKHEIEIMSHESIIYDRNRVKINNNVTIEAIRLFFFDLVFGNFKFGKFFINMFGNAILAFEAAFFTTGSRFDIIIDTFGHPNLISTFNWQISLNFRRVFCYFCKPLLIYDDLESSNISSLDNFYSTALYYLYFATLLSVKNPIFASSKFILNESKLLWPHKKFIHLYLPSKIHRFHSDYPKPWIERNIDLLSLSPFEPQYEHIKQIEILSLLEKSNLIYEPINIHICGNVVQTIDNIEYLRNLLILISNKLEKASIVVIDYDDSRSIYSSFNRIYSESILNIFFHVDIYEKKACAMLEQTKIGLFTTKDTMIYTILLDMLQNGVFIIGNQIENVKNEILSEPSRAEINELIKTYNLRISEVEKITSICSLSYSLDQIATAISKTLSTRYHEQTKIQDLIEFNQKLVKVRFPTMFQFGSTILNNWGILKENNNQ